MRISIASRIFAPEPSAATFRLTALAESLCRGGHEVLVRTVRAPRRVSKPKSPETDAEYQVARFPVLRDAAGYVRGYLPYMSFDIPLFFRILLGRRTDVIVVEPPPTTGVFVRLAAAIRRIPYAYYAADIWSDAASQTGAPILVTRVVAVLEKWALGGATRVFSVSDGVTARLKELGVNTPTTTVGNGVNVAAFPFEGPRVDTAGPLFVYAGTASEWHGANVFVEAFAKLRADWPAARLVFIGGGSEKSALADLATSLGVGVELLDPVPPEELANWLRAASASLASVRPGAGYDFAFPTKLYSSAAAGTPLIFAGAGPAVSFVQTEIDGRAIGEACKHESIEVLEAMRKVATAPPTQKHRAAVSIWAHHEVSIDRAADRIRAGLEELARP